MAIPTYDHFIEPVLRFLATRPEGVPAKDAHEAAAVALEISEGDRQQVVPSGKQRIFKNRAGWAHDRLKRAGLSSSPRHGTWRITAAGLEYVVTRPTSFSPDDVAEIASAHLDVRLGGDVDETAADAAIEGSVDAIDVTTVSPDDRLAQALDELRESVAGDLLETLSTVSPSYFEAIVLDVLHRMGYGASRADLQRVGGTGDGGIDGIISLDKLGLDKVYIQAKRWKGAVGRPDVMAFFGALAGRHAQKGVFLTTSHYTQQALDYARAVDRIVLVDGRRLAELMIDHEVGVTSQLLRVPRLDSDYFDEDVN